MEVEDVSPRAVAGTKAEPERWPMWKLALIALPQLSVQVLWAFVGPNSAPYMLHLGAPPFLATLNNVAGPITGFFTGPLVGAISDNLTSPFGRRRPIILIGLASLWVARMLFAGAEHLFAKETAIFFAAPMYWVMDVTINILQTPHRALVSDLAAPDQQLPTQVIFVVFMAMGNFLAFAIMKGYKPPTDHMLELMFYICALNTAIVGIQFLVAKERPFKRAPDAPPTTACSPVTSVWEAVKNSPKLLYHLAAVQCLVWIGNTAWNLYSGQWFGVSVFEGDDTAPPGSAKKLAYGRGMSVFADGGMLKSVVQLVAALAIIALLTNTKVRPRFLYAPCIFVGVAVSLVSAFVVGHNGLNAELCLMFSVMPEAGSFAIPFGLVAILNNAAAREGKVVSTALQMALLNCCVTVGQQICTVVLAWMEGTLGLEQSLPLIFMVSAIAQGLAGTFTLFLNDAPVDDNESYETTNTEETESGSEE